MAFSVQTLLDNLNDSGNELNMIVLDACRDNPFGWSRSGSRGLSVVGRAPAGSIIMYATSANSTAADGTGRNGLFTSQLLNNIKNQSLSIRDVFDKTGEDVLSVSGGKQHPELSLRFFGASSAYLGARPAPAVQPAPVAQQTPAPVLTVQPAPASAVPSGFVRINGGTFTMGDSASGQRRVSVSSFNVSRYEVTQKEYQEIMGVNPSNFKGDNLPVERVSWFDAVEYCNKRSRREGLTPAYTITGRTPTTEYPITFATVTWNRNADGYRLPTEAEWEYSCRAGTTTAYNTGSSISGNTGWYKANSGSSTKPVGQKPANAWGLHDMHGNVWEWCWDWYEAYPNTAQTDPTGAVSGVNRLMRGGSWFHSAENTASAARNSSNPNGRGSDNGFCLVRP
jgi:formylglycine-generating enzyme required for sulfatase activity